jgi:hypothetical protein
VCFEVRFEVMLAREHEFIGFPQRLG